MSWTGITRDDVVPIAAEGSYPPTATCAALVRIVARERRGSLLRTDIIEGLAGVIGYSFFDMSYEGSYMEILPNDQPLSDQEVLEIDNAIAEMKKWAMRKNEEWIREILIQIMAGKKSYDDLPYGGESNKIF